MMLIINYTVTSLKIAKPCKCISDTQENCLGRELSGKVLDSRLKVGRFEPQGRHCIVVLEQDTFILA